MKLGVESLLSSLAFRCMSIVLVYAVLIMGLFSTVGYLADSRLNSAFPSIDDLEENRGGKETLNLIKEYLQRISDEMSLLDKKEDEKDDRTGIGE